MNEIVAEIQRGDVRLFVGWDIWMGFDILSPSDIGDPIVRELASYFDPAKMITVITGTSKTAMRPNAAYSHYAKRAVALLAVLVSVACPVNAADDPLPGVVIDNVPLPDAIRNLARQSNLNYILDPHVPGSEFGPGRLAPKPSVTVRWTNVTAQTALSALLKEHKLMMVTNPATTVTRIAPAHLGVRPLTTNQAGTNTGSVIPSLVMDSVSLTEAVTKLAGAAGLLVSLDPKLAAALETQGTVSFRWERITVRQALAALLDNYDLVMIPDSATSEARITQKSEPERKQW